GQPWNAIRKSRRFAPPPGVTLSISILKCADSSRPFSALLIDSARAAELIRRSSSERSAKSEPDWHFLSCRPRWRHLLLFLANDGVIRKRADYQKHLEIPRLRSE